MIGGAGTYSAVGARLLSPTSSSSSTIGWIVDEGTDFPQAIRETILSWQTSLVLRPRDGLTTRGWNGYSGNEHRAFKYLTEKKRITADDLTPVLLESKSFHLICSASRCIELVASILEKRSLDLDRPYFIWEPVPDLMTPDELENIKEALHIVDIVSPNHDELGALFHFKHTDTIDCSAVELQAPTLIGNGVGPNGEGSIVVRCGKEGSFVANSQHREWIPAYHQDQAKVIDPTGGGNGFLGGLAIGLVRSKDIIEAIKWASISASFCIEQVGPPVLDDFGSHELWNGCNVFERLQEYKQRLER